MVVCFWASLQINYPRDQTPPLRIQFLPSAGEAFLFKVQVKTDLDLAKRFIENLSPAEQIQVLGNRTLYNWSVLFMITDLNLSTKVNIYLEQESK